MNLKMAVAQLKTIRKGINSKDDKRNMGIIIRYLESIKLIEECEHKDTIRLSLTPDEHFCFDCDTVFIKEIEE